MSRNCHWDYDDKCAYFHYKNRNEDISDDSISKILLEVFDGPGAISGNWLTECPSNGEEICKFFEPKTDEDRRIETERREYRCNLAEESEKFHRQVSHMSYEDWYRPFTI